MKLKLSRTTKIKKKQLKVSQQETSLICSVRVSKCGEQGAPNTFNLFIGGARFCVPPNFPLELILSPCLVRMVGQGILYRTNCEKQHI